MSINWGNTKDIFISYQDELMHLNYIILSFLIAQYCSLRFDNFGISETEMRI